MLFKDKEGIPTQPEMGTKVLGSPKVAGVSSIYPSTFRRKNVSEIHRRMTSGKKIFYIFTAK